MASVNIWINQVSKIYTLYCMVHKQKLSNTAMCEDFLTTASEQGSRNILI